MNYCIYTTEELREEVKDAKKTYEQDKESALYAQRCLAKSELAYYQAKVALLEREEKEGKKVEVKHYEKAFDKRMGLPKEVLDSIFKVREINYYNEEI